MGREGRGAHHRSDEHERRVGKFQRRRYAVTQAERAFQRRAAGMLREAVKKRPTRLVCRGLPRAAGRAIAAMTGGEGQGDVPSDLPHFSPG
jgi:hypothetical protein